MVEIIRKNGRFLRDVNIGRVESLYGSSFGYGY